MSYDIIVEKVPKFTKRLGDWVTQGSNNTIIICGTDRAANGPASISKGLGIVGAPGGGKGTGTIHIIAGRNAEDPDLKDDKSYLYLTMKSKIDTNLNLGSIEKSFDDLPGAILKSDLLRLVFRKNVKLTSADGKNSIYIDGDIARIKIGDTKVTFKTNEVEFGESTSDHMALAKLVKAELQAIWDCLNDFISKYNSHDHSLAGITVVHVGTGSNTPLKPTDLTKSPDSKATAPKEVKDVKSSLVKSK